jgi:beta-glucosidase
MSQRPWLDSAKTLDERVELLLAAMTQAEKIGQLNQIDAAAQDGKLVDPDKIKTGEIGSFLSAGGHQAGNVRDGGVRARATNEIQRIAVVESRLGIPLLFGRDVIHGHRTVFPIPLGQAASWDPELVRQAAEITAREATADGVKWTFTPMVDVSRDPRWGRIAESFGEDPWLASRMAEASVRGLQGENMAESDRLCACAKHFAAYGAAEGGRDYCEVHLGERELRDVYLPPFEAAVRAGVGTLMSAFHVIDGVPCSANRHLLSDVLRGEWGFRGFVVSDYGIIYNMYDGDGAFESHEAACGAALEAGVEMDMMSHGYVRHVPALLERGELSEDVLDEAVRRVLRVKFMCGLFETPYADEERANHVMLTPEHRALARRMVHETSVLLKNDGILPLQRGGQKLLVMGPYTRARSELFGTWTLDGKAEDVTPIGEALRAAAGPGVDLALDSEVAFGDLPLVLARGRDAVIALLGEGPWRSGEDNSVANIELPPGQLEPLQQIHALGIPIVAVVIAGRPLAIPWLVEHARAVLYVFHPGVAGGEGIADLLFGDANPSGRLPAALPRSTAQLPVHYGRRATHRPRPEWGSGYGFYRDALHSPLFPFGFGLGYGALTLGTPRLANATVRMDGKVSVSVEVKNEGARSASEVLQLYVRDLKASVSRPTKELKAFRKVELEPGACTEVTLEVDVKDLAFTGLDLERRVEPGDYKLWLGTNARDGVELEFKVVA